MSTKNKKIWATTIRLNQEKHQECIQAFEELKEVAQERGIPFYQALCSAAKAYTAILKLASQNKPEGVDKNNQ